MTLHVKARLYGNVLVEQFYMVHVCIYISPLPGLCWFHDNSMSMYIHVLTEEFKIFIRLGSDVQCDANPH